MNTATKPRRRATSRALSAIHHYQLSGYDALAAAIIGRAIDDMHSKDSAAREDALVWLEDHERGRALCELCGVWEAVDSYIKAFYEGSKYCSMGEDT